MYTERNSRRNSNVVSAFVNTNFNTFWYWQNKMLGGRSNSHASNWPRYNLQKFHICFASWFHLPNLKHRFDFDRNQTFIAEQFYFRCHVVIYFACLAVVCYYLLRMMNRPHLTGRHMLSQNLTVLKKIISSNVLRVHFSVRIGAPKYYEQKSWHLGYVNDAMGISLNWKKSKTTASQFPMAYFMHGYRRTSMPPGSLRPLYT